jgi:hypothetical protein
VAIGLVGGVRHGLREVSALRTAVLDEVASQGCCVARQISIRPANFYMIAKSPRKFPPLWQGITPRARRNVKSLWLVYRVC